MSIESTNTIKWTELLYLIAYVIIILLQDMKSNL